MSNDLRLLFMAKIKRVHEATKLIVICRIHSAIKKTYRVSWKVWVFKQLEETLKVAQCGAHVLSRNILKTEGL